MKTFQVNSEERFEEGFEIEAESFEDVNGKVLDLIDIHEIDEKTKKIID